ncbi:hypothetical protein [Amycolatopsis dongchuanensis]|uniref:Uncharacterized protein n=1 Tax=Amycolatopsis dongchuanensis TaxID=1070866 RepID=A0ABP8VJX6_9PSEU
MYDESSRLRGRCEQLLKLAEEFARAGLRAGWRRSPAAGRPGGAFYDRVPADRTGPLVQLQAVARAATPRCATVAALFAVVAIAVALRVKVAQTSDAGERV